MNKIRLLTIVLILSISLAFLPTHPSRAATLTVSTTSDEHDGSCSDGDCSLRDAIIIANTNPGADTIAFNIDPIFWCPGGICTIYPGSVLPTLDGDLTIDGYTQPGAAPATASTTAVIKVQIDGVTLLGCTLICNGLNIATGDNQIKGLAIVRFPENGIAIGVPAASGNVIAGNYLGLAPNGIFAPGNGYSGVFIGLGANNNIVGGDEPAERNVISGNGWEGVGIHGSGTTGNTVSGNYIGTDHTGLAALGNTLYGVRIYGGAQNNTIGGELAGERNLLSGNAGDGLRIAGLGTNGNLVIGNYIGTDATGAVDLGNTDSGVKFTNGAQSNLIGGDTPGERNVISGNDDWGVAITGSGTMSNTVSGNFVGTADMGSTGLGNHEGGVLIESGAQNNLIGGNEISGNDGYGVVLFGAGASGNIVTGNLIGLPSGGDETLRNGSTGVYIGDSASNNRIGGEIGEDPYPYGEGNIIVGNNGDGVKITGSGTTHNLVAGNFIGKLPFGPEALGNLGVGVALLDGASENTIGGGETQLNFIGYNHQYGIAIDQEGTDDNLISYNAIGYNQLGGVLVSMGEDNVIGPRNMIVGNGADGVWIVGSDASGNVVTQNGIGENVNDGIDLEGGANGGIVAPSITAQAPGTISGTACSGCTVELFASGDTQGEGWVYLGSAVAAGGVFTVSLIFLPYPYVTATATDTAMGTSEFSVFFTSTLDFAYLPIVSR